MKITAKLFGKLRSHAPPGTEGNVFEEEIDEDAVVEDLLKEWNVPEGITLLILVNSAHKGKEHMLQDGDTLAIFPPVAGG